MADDLREAEIKEQASGIHRMPVSSPRPFRQGEPIEPIIYEGEALPPGDAAIVEAVVKRVSSKFERFESYAESHSGPLPDANTLRQYAELIPNGADRVMRMAEKEQSHRHSIDGTRERRAWAGVFSALIIVIMGLAAALMALHLNYPSVAVIFFGATLIAIVTAFIKGTSTNQNNVEEPEKPVSKELAVTTRENGEIHDAPDTPES